MGWKKGMNINPDKAEKGLERMIENGKVRRANICKECKDNEKGFCRRNGKWCYLIDSFTCEK